MVIELIFLLFFLSSKVSSQWKVFQHDQEIFWGMQRCSQLPLSFLTSPMDARGCCYLVRPPVELERGGEGD